MRAAVVTDDHTFDVAEGPDPPPGPATSSWACVHAESVDLISSHTVTAAGSVLCHQFCGEVATVGHDAGDRWHESQFVAALPLKSCGRCQWCLAGEPAHRPLVVLFGSGEFW